MFIRAKHISLIFAASVTAAWLISLLPPFHGLFAQYYALIVFLAELAASTLVILAPLLFVGWIVWKIWMKCVAGIRQRRAVA